MESFATAGEPNKTAAGTSCKIKIGWQVIEADRTLVGHRLHIQTDLDGQSLGREWQMLCTFTR
jgi:hypothetical protein